MGLLKLTPNENRKRKWEVKKRAVNDVGVTWLMMIFHRLMNWKAKKKNLSLTLSPSHTQSLRLDSLSLFNTLSLSLSLSQTHALSLTHTVIHLRTIERFFPKLHLIPVWLKIRNLKIWKSYFFSSELAVNKICFYPIVCFHQIVFDVQGQSLNSPEFIFAST